MLCESWKTRFEWNCKFIETLHSQQLIKLSKKHQFTTRSESIYIHIDIQTTIEFDTYVWHCKAKVNVHYKLCNCTCMYFKLQTCVWLGGEVAYAQYSANKQCINISQILVCYSLLYFYSMLLALFISGAYMYMYGHQQAIVPLDPYMSLLLIKL